MTSRDFLPPWLPWLLLALAVSVLVVIANLIRVFLGDA